MEVLESLSLVISGVWCTPALPLEFGFLPQLNQAGFLSFANTRILIHTKTL